MADTQAKIVLTAQDKTSGAFSSAKRNLEALQTSAAGIVTRFGAIGLAISGALSAINLKGVIDVADDLGKLSQRTGIAVEDLSALRYAGDLAGVSYDELSVDLKKFNLNIAAGARGSKEQAEAFEAIGISQKFLKDNIGDTKKILDAVADAFTQYADGANKGAIANAIGGKSFEKLIPLLNQGSQGLREARDELQKLGGVITPEMAQRAEEFNDNLTRLGFAAEALKIALAGDLLESLVKLSAELVEAAKNGDLLLGVFNAIDDLVRRTNQQNQDFLENLIGMPRGKVDQLELEAKRLRNIIVGIEATVASDPGNENATRRLEGLRKKLAEVEQQARAAQQALAVGGGRGVVNPAAVVPGNANKKQAPALAGPGAAPDQIALFKAQLQTREQAIAQSLQSEQDIVRFGEQKVQAQYQAGAASLEASFRAQDEARKRNVELIQKAADATVQAEQQFQANLPKPADAAGAARNATEVQGSEGRIQAARAKLQAAEREFAQATELSAIQRPGQRDALQQQVARFESALQDLVDGGRSRAADLADIAAKTRDAEELLIAGGVDPAAARQRAQAYAAQLEQQRQFNAARDEFATLTDRARDAEEALVLAQSAGGTGLLDAERQLYDLRTQELAQLDAIIAKTRDLAQANPGNDAISEELRKIELAAARLKQVQDPTKLRFDAAADNIGNAIADGLSRAVIEGTKLKDVINSISSQIVSIVTQEVITKPLAQSIGNFVKGAGGQGTGQNLITQLFGIGNSGAAAAPSGAPFSLPDVFGGAAKGVSLGGGASGLFGAGPLSGGGESGGVLANPLGDLLGSAAKAATGITGLGGASAATTAIVGRLPELAAIPATTAVSALAVAAEAAAAALLNVAAAGTAGAVGSSGGGLIGSLSGLIGGGGGFGAGANFGYADLGLFLADGGYTGNKGVKEPAGVVHGKEYVFSAPAVKTLGVDALDKLHGAAKAGNSALPGYEAGGYVSALGGAPAASPRVADALLGMGEPTVQPQGRAALPGTHSIEQMAQSVHAALQAAPRPGHADVLAQSVLGGASDANPEALQIALRSADRLALPQPEPDPFAELVRYHTGGIAGLAPDEVPAVLRRGEEVLTQADPRHRDNAPGDSIAQTNNFYVTGGLTRETQEQLAAKVGRQAQRAVARRTM